MLKIKTMWKKRNSGFTLVELLITASMIGMISVAILAAFGAGFHAFERVQAFGGAQADALLSLEQLEQDLRNIFPFSAIGFTGDAKSVSFPGVVTEFNEEDEVESALVGRISYYFDDQKKALVRVREHYAEAVSGLKTDKTPEALAPIEDITFSYYFYKKEVSAEEEKIDYGWKSSWTEEDEGLPKGLRVELVFKRGQRDIQLARTIFIPVGGTVVEVEEEIGEGEGGEGDI